MGLSIHLYLYFGIKLQLMDRLWIRKSGLPSVHPFSCLTQGGDCDVTTGNSRLDEVRNSWESTGIINIDLFFTPNKLLKEKGEDAKKMWTDELKKTEKELNSLFIDGELHDKN